MKNFQGVVFIWTQTYREICISVPLIQEWIWQLKEKDASVQLSGVQNIVKNMWKI